MMQDNSTDVVVVGGGIAGLVAAARAAELGLRVMVLEKGDADRYLCNARYSGGVFHIAFTDIKSPVAALRKAIDTATEGEVDASQAGAMAENGGRLVDWLRTQGAQFVRTQVAWQNFILAPPRPIVAGLEWQGRGPDVLLRRLGENIAKRGGAIERGVRARSLIVEGGRCVGVDADAVSGPRAFRAKAVVLADGGFQANLDMLAEMLPRPERVKQRGAATAIGDGLAMAKAAGAAITRLEHFYGHLLCRDALVSDKVWPYPELDAIATAGIVVDASGARPTDEGVGGVPLANAVAKLPDPLAATIVFDSAIWDGPGKSARIPANPTLASAGGTIHRADTVAELAARAGIDAAGLHRTIGAYNAAVANGTPGDLTPVRSTRKFPALPIAKAPFMAIPIVAGITYTMGGIRVDGSSRVLDRGGAPIAGLYAAGSTTGGLEGGAKAAYIGGLTKAGVQGLLAAEHIASNNNA